jgi:WhiB family redox-sensing transcriptional regulator
LAVGTAGVWRVAVHISHDTSEQPGWQEYANCLGVDPDLFFPERGASTREAKEVCRGCVVRDDCLEFALVNGEKFGIWGGMSERERRRLRRQRAIARRASEAASQTIAGGA